MARWTLGAPRPGPAPASLGFPPTPRPTRSGTHKGPGCFPGTGWARVHPGAPPGALSLAQKGYRGSGRLSGSEGPDLDSRPAGRGGRRAPPPLPASGKVGPVGDHGLGDGPVLGPVAQRSGKGLPKDILEVIRVVGPHPAGVDGHPRRVGEHVGVGLGAPGGGEGRPPALALGSPGAPHPGHGPQRTASGHSRAGSGELPQDSRRTWMLTPGGRKAVAKYIT